jgi:hypothetical protein
VYIPKSGVSITLAEKRPSHLSGKIYDFEALDIFRFVAHNYIWVQRRGVSVHLSRCTPLCHHQNQVGYMRLEVSTLPSSKGGVNASIIRAYYLDGALVEPKPGQTPDPKPCAGNDGTIINVRRRLTLLHLILMRQFR